MGDRWVGGCVGVSELVLYASGLVTMYVSG